MNARSMFDKHRKWRKLPDSFLDVLAERLGSPEMVAEFIQVAEQTGIYKRRIKNLRGESMENPAFMIEMLAGMLTSYANGLGTRGRLSEARGTLELVLRLNPRHIPAWQSMAITESNLDNLEAGKAWAERVLAFEPDPNSDDPGERADAAARSPEGEREAAQALGDPSLVGAWQRAKEDMRHLIELCDELEGH